MHMSAVVILLLAFSVSALLSFAGAPAAALLAKKTDAIDRPSERKRIHTDEVPRLGGLSIFLGFSVAILIFSRLDRQTAYILLGAFAIAAAGIADDIFDLNYIAKLIIQTAAALLVISSGLRIDVIRLSVFSSISQIEFTAGGFLSVLVTLIWIVGLTNAFNMIDGLDGLSCGEAMLSSLALCSLSILCKNTASAISFIAISGACLGFLPFNIHPARLFMGDTGSMLLGFLLSSFSVKFLFSDPKVTVFNIILILALPISELIFTFFRRLLCRRNPMKADNGHIHHLLIAKGVKHEKAVGMLLTFSFVLSALSIIFVVIT